MSRTVMIFLVLCAAALVLFVDVAPPSGYGGGCRSCDGCCDS